MSYMTAFNCTRCLEPFYKETKSHMKDYRLCDNCYSKDRNHIKVVCSTCRVPFLQEITEKKIHETCDNCYYKKLTELAENISKEKCLIFNPVEVKSRRQKLSWICGLGHTFKRSLNEVSGGKTCFQCNQNDIHKKKLALTKLQRMAKCWNGRCTSSSYVDEKTPLGWECQHGHSWTMPPEQIRNGKWCPTCTLDDINSSDHDPVVFIQKQKEELPLVQDPSQHHSIVSFNVATVVELKLQCRNNHFWKWKSTGISNESWCPYCGQHVNILSQ